MYGNTVVTAVTLAIGGNGSKIAYFSHSVGTAVHSAQYTPRDSPPPFSRKPRDQQCRTPEGGGGCQKLE